MGEPLEGQREVGACRAQLVVALVALVLAAVVAQTVDVDVGPTVG